MTIHRSFLTTVLGLVLACAVLLALARPAVCQTPANDHAGDMSMISHSYKTDANGDRIANVTIYGTMGQASFTISGKQADAIFGTPEEPTEDMAALRTLYYAQSRLAFGATDEEWKVLTPKIEKLRRLKTALSSHGKYGGLPGATADLNANWKALTALLAKKDAKQEELKTALKAVNDAEEALKKKIAEAEKDLKGILTVKQEAILVQNHLLD